MAQVPYIQCHEHVLVLSLVNTDPIEHSLFALAGIILQHATLLYYNSCYMCGNFVKISI